jgi:hypothetical protein
VPPPGSPHAASPHAADGNEHRRPAPVPGDPDRRDPDRRDADRRDADRRDPDRRDADHRDPDGREPDPAAPGTGAGDAQAAGWAPPPTPWPTGSQAVVPATRGPFGRPRELLRTGIALSGAGLVRADQSLTDDQLWLARRWAPRVAVVALLLTLASSGWVRALAGSVTVVAAGILVGALVWTWVRLGPRRWGVLGGEERRAQLARMYRDALEDSQPDGLALLHVRRVHHATTQGSRCLVETPDGRSRDAWFWHVRPRRGAVLLVRAQAGTPTPGALTLLNVGTDMTGSGIIRRLPRACWRIGRAELAGRGVRATG